MPKTLPTFKPNNVTPTGYTVKFDFELSNINVGNLSYIKNKHDIDAANLTRHQTEKELHQLKIEDLKKKNIKWLGRTIIGSQTKKMKFHEEQYLEHHDIAYNHQLEVEKSKIAMNHVADRFREHYRELSPRIQSYIELSFRKDIETKQEDEFALKVSNKLKETDEDKPKSFQDVFMESDNAFVIDFLIWNHQDKDVFDDKKPIVETNYGLRFSLPLDELPSLPETANELISDAKIFGYKHINSYITMLNKKLMGDSVRRNQLLVLLDSQLSQGTNNVPDSVVDRLKMVYDGLSYSSKFDDNSIIRNRNLYLEKQEEAKERVRQSIDDSIIALDILRKKGVDCSDFINGLSKARESTIELNDIDGLDKYSNRQGSFDYSDKKIHLCVNQIADKNANPELDDQSVIDLMMNTTYDLASHEVVHAASIVTYNNEVGFRSGFNTEILSEASKGKMFNEASVESISVYIQCIRSMTTSNLEQGKSDDDFSINDIDASYLKIMNGTYQEVKIKGYNDLVYILHLFMQGTKGSPNHLTMADLIEAYSGTTEDAGDDARFKADQFIAKLNREYDIDVLEFFEDIRNHEDPSSLVFSVFNNRRSAR